MKRIIQHFMLLMSLFLMVSHSLHMLEHSSTEEHYELSDDDNAVDSGCIICYHYAHQSIENHPEVEILDWITFIPHNKPFGYTAQKALSVYITHKNLRAPPYLIS